MKTVVINMERSVSRRAKMIAHLKEINIDFEFVRAVDGAAGEHQVFNNYDDKYCIRAWNRPLTSGEIGCFASHYLLWKRCSENNIPLVVMEDDVSVSDKFREVVELLSRSEGVDYVRLSGAVTPRYRRIENTLPTPWDAVRFLEAPLGTQCYALFPGGARKLLAKAERWTMPVDHYMDSCWIHGVPCIGILPFVARHERSITSTISPEGKSPSSIMRNRVWRPKRFAARIYGDVRRGLENVEYGLGLRELPKIALLPTGVREV